MKTIIVLTILQYAPYILWIVIGVALLFVGLYTIKYFGTTLQYEGTVVEITEEKFVLEGRLRRFLTDEEQATLSTTKVFKVTVKGDQGLKMVTLTAKDAVQIKKGSVIIIATRGAWNAPPQDDQLVGVKKY